MGSQPLVTSAKSTVRYIVPPLLLFCGGFLFTVLWFTLMADTQALDYPSGSVPEPVLSMIAAFYQTIFGPMSWLVKVIMLSSLILVTLQLFITSISPYLRLSIFILNVPPILLALFSIVPKAMQFFERADPLDVQLQLLHDVYRGHIISIVCITLFCILQILTIIQLQKRSGNK